MPSHAHTPLALMLVCVQLSVGLLTLGAVPLAFGAAPVRGLLEVASVTALAGLTASLAHLGRPTQAFRAVLGWRTSWMSREILAFGAYVAVLTAAAGAAALGHATPGLLAAAVGLGAVASACSIGVYAVTGRAWWSLRRTAASFAATTLVLGGATLACLALVDAGSAHAAPLAVGSSAAVVAGLGRIVWLRRFVDRPAAGIADDLERSRALLRDTLRPVSVARPAMTVLGLTALSLSVALRLLEGPAAASVAFAVTGLLALVIAELLDRHLFFRAEAARAMPGL